MYAFFKLIFWTINFPKKGKVCKAFWTTAFGKFFGTNEETKTHFRVIPLFRTDMNFVFQTGHFEGSLLSRNKHYKLYFEQALKNEFLGHLQNF